MDSRVHSRQHPNAIVRPTSYPNSLPLSTTPQFTFTTMAHQHHRHHPQQPQRSLASVSNKNPSYQPVNINNSASPYVQDPSTALKPRALTATDSGMKKRGRPRKYSNDGDSIALDMATAKIQHVSSPPLAGSVTSSTEPPAKKHRGRPPSSGKKQLDAIGGGAAGFTPYVIYVENGEDIAAKIMAFSDEGLQTVCILSAHGAIRNVTLRRTTMSGDTVTYEGLFEIISLSGSATEKSSGYNKMDSFSVALAGADGRVLGGVVAGPLTAASQVQVILGTFIAEHKKYNSNNLQSSPAAPSPQMLTFGAPATPTSPTSQRSSSDSSGDNDADPFNRGPGLYNNATLSYHTMPLYDHPLWTGQTQ
ncbi:putative PPC domain, AT hook, DNA-binding protein [Lupinus albus]|uniref:AT-hook motif nuclear-localized protein n=1 Tax=Lupinus albus TaxID=3870 RepID=A0A6A4PZ28_LUPAL|nr:putative PPC domain, AT hook, DNA-binding protein [Lupinus albus]